MPEINIKIEWIENNVFLKSPVNSPLIQTLAQIHNIQTNIYTLLFLKNQYIFTHTKLH